MACHGKQFIVSLRRDIFTYFLFLYLSLSLHFLLIWILHLSSLGFDNLPVKFQICSCQDLGSDVSIPFPPPIQTLSRPGPVCLPRLDNIGHIQDSMPYTILFSSKRGDLKSWNCLVIIFWLKVSSNTLLLGTSFSFRDQAGAYLKVLTFLLPARAQGEFSSVFSVS